MDRNDKKFSFFESYHRALLRVCDERYGRIVRAMSSFVFNGENPNFSDDADWIVWELIRPILERGVEISKIRSEAGGNGGRRGKGVSRNKGNKNAVKIKNQKQNNSKQKQNNSGVGIGLGKEIDSSLHSESSLETNVSLSSPHDAQCAYSIDFDNLMQYFNSKMQTKAIATITKMTSKRKNAVNARMVEYGKEAIQTVIDNAADSTFLNGGGDNGFVASFDWIFRPNNFPKVLEGNYANHTRQQKTYNGSGSTQAERMNDAASLIMKLQQEGAESSDDELQE